MDDFDQESRTASVGSKRRIRSGPDGGVVISSGGSTPITTITPRKKLKTAHTNNIAHDLPKGGSFSALPPQLARHSRSMEPVELSDDSASEGVPINADKPHLVPAMNWNKGANGAIRTSLQGPWGSSAVRGTSSTGTPLPQAPIGLESDEEEEEASNGSNNEDTSSEESGEIEESDEEANQQLHRSLSASEQPSTNKYNHPVSISDDSDVSSGDDAGIMLNMESKPGQTSSSPVSISDDAMEAGEAPSGESSHQVGSEEVLFAIDTQPSNPATVGVPHAPSNGQLDGAAYSVQSDAKMKLGDLEDHQLETQIKYAYFHLQRDQLDLGKPVVCLYCLEEGHISDDCDLRVCGHCGGIDKHESRFCHQYRRCLKCRERGHDVDQCAAKLKDTSVPCDFCGFLDHLEDTCPETWLPSGRKPKGSLALHVSCCRCGSKSHLIGDCPVLTHSSRLDDTHSWSLRSIDPSQITNLTLQPEAQRAESLQNNFGPKPDFRIKGRADRFGPNRSSRRDGFIPSDGEEDDDQFFRAPVNNAPPSRHIRFGDTGGDRRRDEDRNYRFDGPRYDSYEPGEPQSYRERENPFDYRRPRSRSPPRQGYGRRGGGGGAGAGSWKPPLPSGPPPRGPPQGRGGRGAGGRQGESYRPMPSAGKKNWDRYRLGG